MSRESRLSRAFQILCMQARQGFNVGGPDIAVAEFPKIADLLKYDRLQMKPPRSENLVCQWNDAVSRKKVSEISQRSIRLLSWEPEIALSPEFLLELQRRGTPITRSLSKGLTYSLMAKWDSGSVQRLQSYLATAVPLPRTASYLGRVAPLILDRQGPVRIAEQLTERLGGLTSTITNAFGLNASSSEYATAVLNALVERKHQLALSENADERNWFYNEVLMIVDKDAILKCLEMLVPLIDRSQSEQAIEELKRFVLSHRHLGDPRLPGYEGNWPRDHSVTNKVIEWLSQSDISFFFDLFIEKSSDNQGRKQFWLKYAHRVRGSRVIVSDHDKRRFARQLAAMQQTSGASSLFANLKEQMEKSTAFMMDFGNIIVVEFSQSGHACYYYSRNSGFKFIERSAFWTTKSFSISDLKQRSLCEGRMSHITGWEQKFSNELAKFGLRPTPGRTR